MNQRDIQQLILGDDEVKEKAAEIVAASSDAEMLSESDSSDVKVTGVGTAQLGEGGPSTWEVDDDNASDLEAEYADIIKEQEQYQKGAKPRGKVVEVDLTGKTNFLI